MVARQNKDVVLPKTKRINFDDYIPFGFKDQMKPKIVRAMNDVYWRGYNDANEQFEAKKPLLRGLLFFTLCAGVFIGWLI